MSASASQGEGGSGQSRAASPTPAPTKSTVSAESLSSVNSLLVGIQKLKGQVNYEDWSFKMKMIMIRNNTWDVCSGTADREQPDWHMKSDDIFSAIGLTIDHSQTWYIRDCATGPEAWEALKNRYQKASPASRRYNPIT